MTGFIKLFAEHKVAANLLMFIMLISGLYSLTKINFQFFPSFGVDVVSISVVWSGSTAEDVETGITNLIEKEIKSIDGIKVLTSDSSNNVSVVVVEFVEGTDMSDALNKIKDEVAKINNLPTGSKKPVIRKFIAYDDVSKIIISVDGELEELRHYVYKFERELLDAGVGKIDIQGLPEKEIAIEIATETRLELGMSLQNIGNRIRTMSQDYPAGSLGDDNITRRLRAKQQARNVEDYKNIVIKADKHGRFIRLGEIADITLRNKKSQKLMYYQNRPAVQLGIREIQGHNVLDTAKIVASWLAKNSLPTSIHIKVYDQRWRLIKGRLNLLLKNGATGLLFVGLILFLFLNARVAFWVAVGIPTSFMATIAMLYAAGGSINMISMFALIMALGIIVDDAIVVGEDALSHFQRGERPALSVEKGALRMLAPVTSSSLSTIAAFLPLMLVSGIIGKILSDIPLVVICVIIASLIESFIVLPGHLRHAMRNMGKKKVANIRAKLDNTFDNFRDGPFRRFVTLSVSNKRIVLSLALASLILGVGLIAGGKLAFIFFPSPEGNKFTTDISFVSGTARQQVQDFVHDLQQTLSVTDSQLGGGLVEVALTEMGTTNISRDGSTKVGEQYANIGIELIPSAERTVSLKEFIIAWKKNILLPPGLEFLKISVQGGGPPGDDLELRLIGSNADKLKKASEIAEKFIKESAGVVSASSNLPYGQEQFVFKLNAEALALGLTVSQIGIQLRNAYDGYLVQTFIDGDDEIEVRLSIPQAQQNKVASLEQQVIMLPNGKSVLLSNLVEYESIRGFDVLRHADGKLAVTISADLDTSIVVADTMIDKLQREILPKLVSEFGVIPSFEGKNAEQAKTMQDMLTGLVLAIVLMYFILTWVFSSYGWSIVVMSAIPFGLVGAVFGHWLLDINLTILSIFGFFGLSGIVVNDSIVLVTFYRELREQGMAIKEAVIEAACQRLRAVLLTSLTTIVGLLPLLFETSRQAQFLIPMAVSISFGLAFSTFLILLYVPSLLMVYEQIRAKFTKSVIYN